ncbi:MAG: heme biosynthesis protein HemY [Alphaproteobacteria bacterium RIFOXYD12_FULL_60_8]|nr:MAG: heme biosynthesis protein HemY [Alphaproteobacteria bacterium RIFOXYD12_FULL_60_8]
MALTLTPSAAKRIAALIQADGREGLMFRVEVSGGGCSGFQYAFALDDAQQEDDITFAQHGVPAVVDTATLDLIDGAEVDYVEDLMGSAFRVRNPHATATCGCGSSFSV